MRVAALREVPTRANSRTHGRRIARRRCGRAMRCRVSMLPMRPPRERGRSTLGPATALRTRLPVHIWRAAKTSLDGLHRASSLLHRPSRVATVSDEVWVVRHGYQSKLDEKPLERRFGERERDRLGDRRRSSLSPRRARISEKSPSKPAPCTVNGRAPPCAARAIGGMRGAYPGAADGGNAGGPPERLTCHTRSVSCTSTLNICFNWSRTGNGSRARTP